MAPSQLQSTAKGKMRRVKSETKTWKQEKNADARARGKQVENTNEEGKLNCHQATTEKLHAARHPQSNPPHCIPWSLSHKERPMFFTTWLPGRLSSNCDNISNSFSKSLAVQWRSTRARTVSNGASKTMSETGFETISWNIWRHEESTCT